MGPGCAARHRSSPSPQQNLILRCGRSRARRLLRQGNIEPAIVSARQTLEPVRDEYGTQNLFAAPGEKTPRQRGLDERWAFTLKRLSTASDPQ